MKKKFSVDHLPFGVLSFDPDYQRQLIPARVRALRNDWNLDEVGAIIVSIRPDDPKTAYVIDGQHRVRAAIDLGLNDTKVLCHVYRGLTREEEARKFLAANNVRAVTPYDKFRAGLVARDPLALSVRDTAKRYGWEINNNGGDGRIACVAELMKIQARDPELLDRTLGITTEAWGTRASAVERALIAGLAQVLATHNGSIDNGSLVKKLSKYKGGAAAIVGDARGLVEYKGGSLARAVAEVVVTTYNKGRRSGQVAPL